MIEVEERTVSNDEETIQTIAQVSPIFLITSEMLQMDEGIAQTPVKYLA
jgi:hypothetical protein